MSAQDNLSHELFHASPNVMKKGTIIKPIDKRYDWAWAGDRARADKHGRLLHSNFIRTHQWEQKALFHPVYKVEPLKTDKTFEQTTAGQPTDMKTYKSEKGFRVKGFSHFVEPGEV